MKKIAILIMLIAFSASNAYAFKFKIPGFGKMQKEDKPMLVQNSEKEESSGVNISIGDDADCNKKVERIPISQWNMELSLPWFHMPHQDARKQFVTTGMSLSVSYKPSGFIGWFTEYTNTEDKGITFNGENEKYTRTDLHAGILFMVWSGQNTLEARIGLGGTELKLDEADKEYTMGGSFYLKTAYFFNWPNMSIGPFLQYIEVDNEKENQAEYVKGGTTMVGVIFSFGIPAANK